MAKESWNHTMKRLINRVLPYDVDVAPRYRSFAHTRVSQSPMSAISSMFTECGMS